MAEKKRYQRPGSISSVRLGAGIPMRAGGRLEQPFPPGERSPAGDTRMFNAGASQLVSRTPSGMQGVSVPSMPAPSPMAPRMPSLAGPRSLQESALQATQFGQLPAAFQQRFQQRQASGLNQGFTEQDAVNYYNQNYLARGRGLQPDAGAVAYGPGVQRPAVMTGQQPGPVSQPAMQAVPQGLSLADQLEQQRLSGQGMFAGPTPQERRQFVTDVATRAQQNPSPINQFLGQELMGRTREGRRMGMEDLEQGYLARPMQGGMFRGSTADTMRDREQRLSMLEAGRTARSQQAEQESAERDRVWKQALADKLGELGYDQQALNQLAEERQDRRIAEDPNYALGKLAPGGTVVRTPVGTFVKGYEQSSERREQRLAGLPARRERDRLAVANRLDRMRIGRQMMMDNQQAAQRQAMEMTTNPIANPMLLAGNPYAMTEAMRLGQQQREFMANAPMRQLQMYGQGLQNYGETLRNQASEQMLSPEFQAQQRQERARTFLAQLDPGLITAMGPRGQMLLQTLQQEAMGGEVAGPQGPPASIPEAEANVMSATPVVQSILRKDPTGMSAPEIRSTISELERQGIAFTPADKQSIEDYITSRSMYDPQFVNPQTGVVGELWNVFKSMIPRFPGTAPGSPTPPQFTYPRMGPG